MNLRLAPPVRSRCDGDHKNALFCRVLHIRRREGGTVVTRTRNGAPSMPLPFTIDPAYFFGLTPACPSSGPCWPRGMPAMGKSDRAVDVKPHRRGFAE